jgi:hypothetical protein
VPNKQSRHQQGFNGPGVRDLNRALVLEAIRQDPGIGRADIAASTRLIVATITNIVAALIEKAKDFTGVKLFNAGHC